MKTTEALKHCQKLVTHLSGFDSHSKDAQAINILCGVISASPQMCKTKKCDIPFEVAIADAPTLMTWDEAIKYAADLPHEEGSLPWRLPTKDELNLMYENREAIGGFDLTGWYWSSSPVNYNFAWVQRFSDGLQCNHFRVYVNSVRVVR